MIVKWLFVSLYHNKQKVNHTASVKLRCKSSCCNLVKKKNWQKNISSSKYTIRVRKFLSFLLFLAPSEPASFAQSNVVCWPVFVCLTLTKVRQAKAFIIFPPIYSRLHQCNGGLVLLGKFRSNKFLDVRAHSNKGMTSQ